MELSSSMQKAVHRYHELLQHSRRYVPKLHARGEVNDASMSVGG